jgi:hypothetical protein
LYTEISFVLFRIFHIFPQSMELPQYVDRLRAGKGADFPAEAKTLSFAQKLDSQDSLAHLRDEFIIPTKASMKKTALNGRIPGMFTNSCLVCLPSTCPFGKAEKSQLN